MYSSQSRLDTTHQKAIALSEIHKYQEAHDVLQTALQYKKNVRTYSVLVENAVTTFATLCVRLKSPAIRNVLADFRQCAAASHPKSLENVIVQFVQAAEKTAESDLKAITADASSSSSSDEITPEMLMSMAESDPHAIKEHRDRSKSPSVMYLWEAYRYATECIRHTRQLLPLYADLCEKALAAFAKYKRHYEFRRFFSQLRDSRDFSSQPRVPVPVIPSGQPLDPEKQRLKEEQEKMNELNSRLRIRLAQLNTAIALDYWNEVYETISDLHETIPKTMASTCTLPLYTAILERLAHFFWSTNNTLYFAYTLFKLQKIASVYNADPNSPHSVKYLSSNASVLADCTVLAVLSLSPSERTTTDDEFGLQVNEHDNANKFVSFLGLPSESPRRSRLLELLTQEGYLNTISPDVRDLYVALEHSVPALSMRRRAGPALDRIAVDGVYSRFAQQLCAQFVLRLLQRMSNIYSSISMDRLAALAPSQLTWGQLERIILQHASSGAVPVRVDHKEKYVVFVHATLEAPTLRDQLTTVSDALRQIHRNYLSPAVYKDDKDKERKQVFFLVREGMKKDHEAVYERIDYIAKRKEDEENAIREREMQREEEAKAAEEKRIREAEEAKKREAEQKEKEEKERVKREQEAQQRKQVVDYVQKAISAVPEHLLASKRVKQMASLTGKMGTGALKQDELIQAAKRLELEQRADRERRKREDYKKVDYLVRALRMEEQSLLATEHSVKAAEHSKNMAKQMEEEKIRHREHWELASKEKVRLARVEPLRQAHIQHIMAKREEEYKQAMAKYEEEMKEYERVKAEIAAAEEAARLAKEAEHKALLEQLEAQRKEDEAREAERMAAEQEKMERDAEYARIAQGLHQVIAPVKSPVAAKEEYAPSGPGQFRDRREGPSISSVGQGSSGWGRQGASGGRSSGGGDIQVASRGDNRPSFRSSIGSIGSIGSMGSEDKSFGRKDTPASSASPPGGAPGGASAAPKPGKYVPPSKRGQQ